MSRRELKDRRALITGASSGIGAALAVDLAIRGVDCVLLARRADRLAQLQQQIATTGRRSVVVAGDVTDPSIRSRAIAAAQSELGGLDILVNNAGIAAHGRFADAAADRLRPIMEVNFFAPVELIRESLPLLKRGSRPIVVNIGSILGHRGCPHKSEYSASKFALHGFSEAVRPELARLGIDLLIVAAGPTDTEHFDTLIEQHGELPWGNPRRRPAPQVARQIVRAIERNRREVITSWRGWFWLLLNRVSPTTVDGIMARYG